MTLKKERVLLQTHLAIMLAMLGNAVQGQAPEPVRESAPVNKTQLAQPTKQVHDGPFLVANDGNFVAEIKNATVPVFVYFTSSDKKATHSAEEDAALKQVAGEYFKTVKFIMVDVAKNPEIAQANGIPAVPTSLMIKPDTPVLYNVGYMPADELRKFIDAGMTMKPAPKATASKTSMQTSKTLSSAKKLSPAPQDDLSSYYDKPAVAKPQDGSRTVYPSLRDDAPWTEYDSQK